MITLELVTFSLLAFTWFTKGIPISNRSSGYGSTVQLSREYLPVKNSDHHHLGYHYDNKVIVTTHSPLGVIPIISNDYNRPSIKAGVSQSDTKIYGPTGIITKADGIVELETPTRPVQEVISDSEYQTFGEYKTIRTKTDHHTFVNTFKLQEENNKKKHLNIAAQTVASAITTLDWLLDDKGYNSPIHPPPSPILALVLSKYGRYLPVTRGPRVYPYMAANNIHNSQPFGQYKWSCEQDIED